jgi:chromosome segregation ATPase
MATNGLEMTMESVQPSGLLDKTQARNRALDTRALDADYSRSGSEPDPANNAQDFALAPLVDKIAYGIATGLVAAIRELEQHIANETRKVGDAVDRRLDVLQTGMQEVSRFVVEQRSANTAFQGQLQELSTGLQETDARQSAAVEALRTETKTFSTTASQRIDAAVAAQKESDTRREAEMKALALLLSDRIEGICREMGVQQEDLSAIKTTLGAFLTRVDALAERLDRQAEAVRSMYTAYSQRETELEQLVDGLARLRAFPAPMPSSGL